MRPLAMVLVGGGFTLVGTLYALLNRHWGGFIHEVFGPDGARMSGFGKEKQPRYCVAA